MPDGWMPLKIRCVAGALSGAGATSVASVVMGARV
jgi:hypothetical protein